MTNKDLIEKLKKFPEDMEIVGQWNDIEYGYSISQHISFYKKIVKNTNGHYNLSPCFQYGKELPSSDVEVLVINVEFK